MAGNGPHVVVSAILLDRGGRVLLGESPKWKNQWTIPGGKVQLGERLLDALRREIKEETGIVVSDAEVLRVSESIFEKSYRDGTWHLIFIDFVCRDFDPSLQLDNRELTCVRWVPVESATDLPLSATTRATLDYFLRQSSKSHAQD